jgi:hypothetical protein
VHDDDGFAVVGNSSGFRGRRLVRMVCWSLAELVQSGITYLLMRQVKTATPAVPSVPFPSSNGSHRGSPEPPAPAPDPSVVPSMEVVPPPRAGSGVAPLFLSPQAPHPSDWQRRTGAEGALRAPRLAIRVLTGCKAESRRWLLTPPLFRFDATHLTWGCETRKVLDLFFSVFHSGLLPKMGYFGVHYVTPVPVVGWCKRRWEYFGGLAQS